jgi:hypothetical protein
MVGLETPVEDNLIELKFGHKGELNSMILISFELIICEEVLIFL